MKQRSRLFVGIAAAVVIGSGVSGCGSDTSGSNADTAVVAETTAADGTAPTPSDLTGLSFEVRRDPG